MKTIQQLREEKALNEKAPQLSDMPFVILLKRKSIRRYPDGVTVALYYSDKLKRYVSIPFGDEDSTIDAGKEI